MAENPDENTGFVKITNKIKTIQKIVQHFAQKMCKRLDFFFAKVSVIMDLQIDKEVHG